MVRLFTLLTVVATATAVTALRIRSVTHSGPGCPQDARVTWAGADELTVTLADFGATLAPGQTTSCQVHVAIDQGEGGRALALRDAVVRGGLYVGAEARADFYTTAFWSETASDTVTKQSSVSAGSSAVLRNVAVAQRVNAASTCVRGDGYVGIVNVGFRIVAQGGGKVVFGRERKDGGGTAPVTESLSFVWQGC